MVNWKGVVVLLVLVAALGAYLYQTRPPAKPAGPTGKVFLGCTAGDAVELEIDRANGVKLLVTRPTAVGRWAVVLPKAAPAVDSTVDSLITELHFLAPTDTIARPDGAADYGFDSPQLNVRCRVGAGNSFNLSVGKQSFDGTSRYARLAGDPKVYVISGAEVDRLDQALDQPPYRPSPIPSGPSPSPTT